MNNASSNSASSTINFRKIAELFLASFIALFFEMLIIRWLSAEVRFLSYFKNLTMMAAFLGLGIGFALANRKQTYWKWFAPLTLLLVVFTIYISKVLGGIVIVPETGEYLWQYNTFSPTLSTILFTLLITVFFIYSLTLFIPLGQLVGQLMDGFKPIRAYIINLIGSLAGIWAFALLSYLFFPPLIWFTVGFLSILWFIRKDNRHLLISGVSMVLTLGILFWHQGETLWSPYYRVDIFPVGTAIDHAWGAPEETGYDLYVNQIGHMTAINLNEVYLSENPEYAATFDFFKTIYDLPYAISTPDNVLVVGAGTGNDIAAGLRAGVPFVDGVEIDPLIYQIASKNHPEQPFDHPGVTIYIDDARAYFEKTDKTYDLIVFGILDSQTLLSGMSNVRLDNFVYTEESIEQARSLLNEDGVISMTFFAQRWWIKERLAQTLEAVFGTPPVQLQVADTPWVMYLIGENLNVANVESICDDMDCSVEAPSSSSPIPLATDDWPFLYLQTKSVPLQYWIVLIVVLGTAWIGMKKAFPQSQGLSLNWHYFLLGGAFLLVEFKSITELALLFGSTWVVNAFAVTAVLIMVLFANLFVSKAKNLKVPILYLFLFGALVLGYFVPLRVLLPFSAAIRLLFAIILIGLPLFFSSMIFAVSLKNEKNAPLAFASNFFGSAVGGVLEYASLAFGIRSLYLLGAVLYIGSWLVRKRK